MYTAKNMGWDVAAEEVVSVTFVACPLLLLVRAFPSFSY